MGKVSEAEVEDVEHNGIIQLFCGEEIGFIVEMFAARRTRKGPTFKSVKDIPPARCVHRNLQILRHRCQTAGE